MGHGRLGKDNAVIAFSSPAFSLRIMSCFFMSMAFMAKNASMHTQVDMSASLPALSASALIFETVGPTVLSAVAMTMMRFP